MKHEIKSTVGNYRQETMHVVDDLQVRMQSLKQKVASLEERVGIHISEVITHSIFTWLCSLLEMLFLSHFSGLYFTWLLPHLFLIDFFSDMTSSADNTALCNSDLFITTV